MGARGVVSKPGQMRGNTASIIGTCSGATLSVDSPRTTLHNTWLDPPSMEALPSHIDPELLRAVPVFEVLRGFGKHWSSNAGCAEDYNLSGRVEVIDDFLSHDWGTTRWEKTFSLCLLYNGHAACIVSCAIAFPLAVAGGVRDLYFLRGHLAIFICPFVYIAVLVFWQSILKHFCTSRYVFLDKLCIHQTDEVKKAGGILGLAGFLRASKRLVLVWSPRYFSRLWCTYELVSWCFLHGADGSKVCFLPVASCLLQGAALASLWANYSIKALLDIHDKESGGHASGVFAGLIVSFFVCIFVGIATMPMLFNLRRLQEQVLSFRIRDSKCFCCTHHHVHPDSGKAMACDRKLVYSTLQKWYLHSLRDDGAASARAAEDADSIVARSLEVALDWFDEMARSELSRMLALSVTTNGGLTFLTYKECVSLGLPAMWSAFDYTLLLCHDGCYLDAIRWLFEYSTVPLFIFPLSAAMALQSTSWVERLTYGMRFSCCRALLCPCVFVSVLFSSMLLLWFPGRQLTILTQDRPLGLLDLLPALRYACKLQLTRLVEQSYSSLHWQGQ
eukprot:TRINITY_DN17979_c0_g2_i1.p1 TRINITY_DN17979_c0_g2~~TRINITY_DN17979_c0_g2_i1.p1  ORF type:complete len:602 (+),score=5.35 TRINITY_DN17979_c0_g2_i1:131-1807(+)